MLAAGNAAKVLTEELQPQLCACGAAAEWPGSFHEEVGGEYVKESLGKGSASDGNVFWMAQKPKRKPTVSTSLAEIGMGTKILRRRLPEWRVLRCERIEDAVLWDKYTAKRAQRCGQTTHTHTHTHETAESIQFSANTTLDHGVNEVWLLHGTSEEAAKAISRSSFLPSSEGCFGTGVYFADDAKKSNQYAKGRTEDNCKIMLLCRVILGNVMVLPKGQDRTADRFAEDPHVDPWPQNLWTAV
ncbi:unnamed protein product [Effrenium voratum]|nr:unnamed protein product [Effrenium voratum]